jgi:hypothetical protein
MPRNPQTQAETVPNAAKFADAMRRLVSVPLAEVVTEEKKWKAMRKQLKKQGEAKGGKRWRD